MALDLPSLISHAVLGIGVALLASGIVLSFRGSQPLSAGMMLILGVLCCIVDDPRIQNAVFHGPGYDVSVTMKDVEQKVTEAKVDIKQQDAAPVNLKLEDIAKALARQEDFNKLVVDRLNHLESAAPAHTAATTALQQPDILKNSSSYTANNSYSVLVFYRDSRNIDAKVLVSALTTAGFQASSINSSLGETQVGVQPDNSTYVIPTDHGQSVAEAIGQIVRHAIPAPRNDAVTIGASHPLRRGDVQIYLY